MLKFRLAMWLREILYFVLISAAVLCIDFYDFYLHRLSPLGQNLQKSISWELLESFRELT